MHTIFNLNCIIMRLLSCLKTLSCGMALIVIGVTAHAYTVNELVAPGGAVASYKLWNYTGAIYNLSQGVKFERVDDTHIRICGMSEQKRDFVFTLSSSQSATTENPTTNGQYLKIHYETFADAKPGETVSYYTGWRLIPQNSREGYSVFRISTNDMGGYDLRSVNSGIGINTRSTSTMVDAINTFSSIEISSFVPNATASDTYVSDYNFTNSGSVITSITPATAAEKREYPVYVEYDNTTNRFSILNLGNNGYGYRSQIVNSYNLHGPNQYSNNEQSWTGYPGLFKIGGTVDPETGKMTFDKNQFCVVYSDGYAGYSSYTYYHYLYQLERINLTPGYEVVDELFGTMKFGDNVYHNAAEESWVTNGGKRRTFEDMSISIEPYTYYINELSYNVLNFAGSYSDTEIHGADVTNQVELTIDHHEWSTDEGLVINAHLNTIKNDQYVDHYDVMMVEGNYSSINDPGFAPHPDLGHKTASAIITGAPASEHVVSTSGNHDYTFSRVIAPAGTDNGFDTGKAYTLFVRTHYKEGTNLNPTFHSLQTIILNTPTGVENVNADGTVTTSKHHIYDIYGRCVTNPAKGHIYIIDGKTVKY